MLTALAEPRARSKGAGCQRVSLGRAKAGWSFSSTATWISSAPQVEWQVEGDPRARCSAEAVPGRSRWGASLVVGRDEKMRIDASAGGLTVMSFQHDGQAAPRDQGAMSVGSSRPVRRRDRACGSLSCCGTQSRNLAMNLPRCRTAVTVPVDLSGLQATTEALPLPVGLAHLGVCGCFLGAWPRAGGGRLWPLSQMDGFRAARRVALPAGLAERWAPLNDDGGTLQNQG